jgi:hypothetical protein
MYSAMCPRFHLQHTLYLKHKCCFPVGRDLNSTCLFRQCQKRCVLCSHLAGCSRNVAGHQRRSLEIPRLRECTMRRRDWRSPCFQNQTKSTVLMVPGRKPEIGPIKKLIFRISGSSETDKTRVVNLIRRNTIFECLKLLRGYGTEYDERIHKTHCEDRDR